MDEVSLDDQIACVRRELAMRANVYRRRVSEGRMTQEEAHKETRAMEAVLATVEAVKAEKEPNLI